MRRRNYLLALPLLLATVSAEAAAPPSQSFVYDSLTAARVNPLGLIEVFEVGYKVRLYDSSSPLFADNFMQLSLRPVLTPAWGRVAAVARVQPASFFQFWAEYGGGGHFGTFGLMQSFPTADAPASDTVLDQNEADGLNYSAGGTQFGFGFLLQAKVGPIAARSSSRFINPNHDLRDGDTAFYDIVYDLVIPNKGWAMNTDTDLLWVSDFGLVLGARWTYTHAFTGAEDLSPSVTDNPNSPLHRVGPLIAWTFWDEPGTAFNKPTVLVIANWWLKHPSRTGEDVSQAFPYTIIGFRFSGDLWRGE